MSNVKSCTLLKPFTLSSSEDLVAGLVLGQVHTQALAAGLLNF